MLLARCAAVVAFVACATPSQSAPPPPEEDSESYPEARAVVAERQSGLFPCLRPKLKGLAIKRVPIAFTITVGKVSGVVVDEPALRNDAELAACLMAEIGRWPFPAGFYGTIELSIKVGRPP
jgi:hypothetical protein